MVKLFGLRITPFFLFILGMECLALLLSIYLGILLYRGTPEIVTTESYDQLVDAGVFLLILVSLLTPGFFSQIKIIKKVKKSVNEIALGFTSALLTMLVIVFGNYSNLGTKTIFVAALLSACVGLSVTKLNTLGKYWRFLVRPDVN